MWAKNNRGIFRILLNIQEGAFFMKELTIKSLEKSSILDVSKGFEYASEQSGFYNYLSMLATKIILTDDTWWKVSRYLTLSAHQYLFPIVVIKEVILLKKWSSGIAFYIVSYHISSSLPNWRDTEVVVESLGVEF